VHTDAKETAKSKSNCQKQCHVAVHTEANDAAKSVFCKHLLKISKMISVSACLVASGLAPFFRTSRVQSQCGRWFRMSLQHLRRRMSTPPQQQQYHDLRRFLQKKRTCGGKTGVK